MPKRKRRSQHKGVSLTQQLVQSVTPSGEQDESLTTESESQTPTPPTYPGSVKEYYEGMVDEGIRHDLHDFAEEAKSFAFKAAEVSGITAMLTAAGAISSDITVKITDKMAEKAEDENQETAAALLAMWSSIAAEDREKLVDATVAATKGEVLCLAAEDIARHVIDTTETEEYDGSDPDEEKYHFVGADDFSEDEEEEEDEVAVLAAIPPRAPTP